MNMAQPPIRQLAYYANDVEAAARRHSALFGSGPFLSLTTPCQGVDRGRPIVFTNRYCLGQWGDIMIEFITKADVPTVIDDLAIEGPGMRPHHVGIIVEDLDAEIARYEAAGYPLALTGSPVAMPDLRFAFMDSAADLGHLIELYPAVPTLLESYENVRRLSIGWNGKDPVRIV